MDMTLRLLHNNAHEPPLTILCDRNGNRKETQETWRENKLWQKTGKRWKGKDSGLFSQSGSDVHRYTQRRANIRDDEVTGRSEELQRGERWTSFTRLLSLILGTWMHLQYFPFSHPLPGHSLSSYPFFYSCLLSSELDSLFLSLPQADTTEEEAREEKRLISREEGQKQQN